MLSLRGAYSLLGHCHWAATSGHSALVSTYPASLLEMGTGLDLAGIGRTDHTSWELETIGHPYCKPLLQSCP